MAYASLAEFKQFIGATSDDRDIDIQRALDAASSQIDEYTGRRFSIDAADVTTYYYPSMDGVINVVDLVSVTSIKTDSTGNRSYATTLATTDYELLPVNGSRYEQVRIWPQSSRTFYPGYRVQVVGKFGYVDADDRPPPQVVQACLLLCNRYYNRKQNPFGILQSPDLGTYTRISSEDPDVKALLKPFTLTGGAWVVV